MEEKEYDKIYDFPDGCMWEGGAWQIAINYQCSADGGGEPCVHCHSRKTITHTNMVDGSIYAEEVWVCPRVVIADNEGGYDSTGVCLDCILDAVKEIGV